jgi:ech hydrogenase subunit D
MSEQEERDTGMQSVRETTPGNLLQEVQAMKDEGRRLVQICCSVIDEQNELLYSFEHENGSLDCLRLHIPLVEEGQPGPELPSISAIYGCSFGYENELKDLFGFRVNGLQLDFQGNFIQTRQKTPFAGNIKIVKPDGEPAAQPAAEEAKS